MINSLLPLLCQIILKDTTLLKNQEVFNIFSHFKIISYFLFTEIIFGFQSSSPMLSKIKEENLLMIIHNFYQCNYEEVILTGFLTNDYLKNSWENIINGFHPILQKFISYQLDNIENHNFFNPLSIEWQKKKAAFDQEDIYRKSNEYQEFFELKDKMRESIKEFDTILEQTPKYSIYKLKLSIHTVLILKKLTLAIDLSCKLLYLSLKGVDSACLNLLQALKKKINEGRIFLTMLEKMPFLPTLLENLLFLESEYFFHFKDSFLNQELKSIVLTLKEEIDTFFYKNMRNPRMILETIERSLDKRIYVEPEWEEEKFLSLIDHDFYISDTEQKDIKITKGDLLKKFQFSNFLEKDVNENHLKDLQTILLKMGSEQLSLPRETPFSVQKEETKDSKPPSVSLENLSLSSIKQEDFYSEKFAFKSENLAKKVLYSKVFNFLMKESFMKTFIEEVLDEYKDTFKYLKNHIDYPYYCDFLVEFNKSYTFALFTKDPEKLVLGVENVLQPYFVLVQKYYQRQKIHVLFIDSSFYHVKKEVAMTMLKDLMNKKIESN